MPHVDQELAATISSITPRSWLFLILSRFSHRIFPALLLIKTVRQIFKNKEYHTTKLTINNENI